MVIAKSRREPSCPNKLVFGLLGRPIECPDTSKIQQVFYSNQFSSWMLDDFSINLKTIFIQITHLHLVVMIFFQGSKDLKTT